MQKAWDKGKMKRRKECTSSLFQITGKELCETLDKVPEIGEAVFKMKQEVESSINCIKPENAISIMGKNVVYYHSASINGNSCQCIFSFWR